jgi:hypothetical protein
MAPTRKGIPRRRKIPRVADSGATAPSAPLVAQSGRARGVGLPRRNNSMGWSGATLSFRAARLVRQQDGHPHLRSAPAAGPRPPANQVPPGPGPAPLALPKSPVLLACAASVGPERHWRKRRGPPASDGLGNRGAIRARLRCKDREHGGTRAVSRRTGSPREPRSEGPRVLLFFAGRTQTSFRLRRNVLPSPAREGERSGV